MNFSKINTAATSLSTSDASPCYPPSTSLSEALLSQSIHPMLIENESESLETTLNANDVLSAMQEYNERRLLIQYCDTSYIFSLLDINNNFSNNIHHDQLNQRSDLISEGTEILDGIGNILARKGLFTQSLICHNRALDLKKQQGLNNSISLATSIISFAYLNYLKGEYNNALNGYREALEALEGNNCFHQNALELVSEIYLGLGLVCTSQANYIEASSYLDQALNMKANLYPENSHKLAEVYQAIGQLYCAKGFYEESLVSLRKAYTIRAENYGEEDLETLRVSNDIVLTLVKLCKYEDAISLVKTTLDSLINKYGESHSEVSRSHSSLASAYRVQGNFEEAAKYFNKSIEIDRKVYGEMHEIVGRSYGNLGNVYMMQGKYKEAEEYCEKFLEIATKVFNKEHPLTAMAEIQMKAIFIYLNKNNLEGNCDIQELFNDLERILKLQENFYGAEHVDLCLSFIVLGNAYRYTKRCNFAVECYGKALNIAYKKQDNYMAAYIHRYLAFTYKMVKNEREALLHSNKGLRLWSKFPSSARAQGFADPDFYAHVINNFHDATSAKKYMVKARQLAGCLENKDWISFADGAVKGFDKKEAKGKAMFDELF